MDGQTSIISSAPKIYNCCLKVSDFHRTEWGQDDTGVSSWSQGHCYILIIPTLRRTSGVESSRWARATQGTSVSKNRAWSIDPSGRQLVCYMKGWSSIPSIKQVYIPIGEFHLYEEKKKLDMVIYFCKFSTWEIDRLVRGSKPSKQDLISKEKQLPQKSNKSITWTELTMRGGMTEKLVKTEK